MAEDIAGQQAAKAEATMKEANTQHQAHSFQQMLAMRAALLESKEKEGQGWER